MDSDRFDALSRTLGKPESRRGALATLAALAGFGALAPNELDAKKKKKKKKKKKPPPCKTTNQNCNSGSDCCKGLICAVGSFQEECESVDGDVCCLTPGKACSHTCDCCGSGSICATDDKCCLVSGANCTEHSDCCEEEFCVDELFGEDKTCRSDNNGSACDNDDDCLGNVVCIAGTCGCLISGDECTDDRECCLGIGCNLNGRCGCVPFAGNCEEDEDCCEGNKCTSGVCHCGTPGEPCVDDEDCCNSCVANVCSN